MIVVESPQTAFGNKMYLKKNIEKSVTSLSSRNNLASIHPYKYLLVSII